MSDQKRIISSIHVYPIKSLDGVQMNVCKISKGGALEFDRMFALKDSEGEYINAKKYPNIQKLRVSFDLDAMDMTILRNGNNETFNLISDSHIISDWFADYFLKKVNLERNDEIGFPDDPKRPGPTICSLESIKEVAEWFPDLDEAEIRRRFRTNIELQGGKYPFWEDQLLNTQDKPGEFRLGEVDFQGIKPCPRCPVPSRNSRTAIPSTGFQKQFSDLRQSNIGEIADPLLFPHYYMFALNTRITKGQNGVLKVGDELEL